MAGPWERYAQQSNQGFTQISPADPRLPAQVESTQLGNQRTRQQMGQDAAIAPLQVREQRAKTIKAERDLAAQGEPGKLTPEALKSVRLDAAKKFLLARQLKKKSEEGLFATGFMAPTMAGWGGTNAADVEAGAGTLKAGGALAEILKLTAQNGGKNPFTPMSNSDVDLIARNVANLDVKQTDKTFQQSVGAYEGAYKRGFMGAGGNYNALLRQLDKLGLATPAEKAQLQKQGAKPAGKVQPRSQSRVIDFNDLPE